MNKNSKVRKLIIGLNFGPKFLRIGIVDSKGYKLSCAKYQVVDYGFIEEKHYIQSSYQNKFFNILNNFIEKSKINREELIGFGINKSITDYLPFEFIENYFIDWNKPLFLICPEISVNQYLNHISGDKFPTINAIFYSKINKIYYNHDMDNISLISKGRGLTIDSLLYEFEKIINFIDSNSNHLKEGSLKKQIILNNLNQDRNKLGNKIIDLDLNTIKRSNNAIYINNYETEFSFNILLNELKKSIYDRISTRNPQFKEDVTLSDIAYEFKIAIIGINTLINYHIYQALGNLKDNKIQLGVLNILGEAIQNSEFKKEIADFKKIFGIKKTNFIIEEEIENWMIAYSTSIIYKKLNETSKVPDDKFFIYSGNKPIKDFNL